ncbi:MAG: polysaccharide deacetylase family protein, partial [Saprospiraceae bacterium]|nr:polysaccharide deacetylase family protein [Saprospiraceae bacterium]
IIHCLLGGVLALTSSAQNDPTSSVGDPYQKAVIRHGALERADTSKKHIYLTFTGGDFNDGSSLVERTLRKKKIKAHFFFTGDFYRSPDNYRIIRKLKKYGHYLGPHSDKHLLYVDWNNRDSLLVTKEEFTIDLLNNYQAMEYFQITKSDAPLFLPPYEWYNQQISEWTTELGLILINFTPGTGSNADYTTPDMGERYVSSSRIYQNILNYESQSPSGLNGFILLLHIGTHPDRTDKFYARLAQLIDALQIQGYRFSLLPTDS